MGLKWGKSEH